MKKKLVIINNEKCVKFKQSYFCQNIEISSLSYSLLKNFYLYLEKNIEKIFYINLVIQVVIFTILNY